MSKLRLIILAGPNGAGKSTIAKYLLTEKYLIDEFVNADAIAVGLSAFAPEAVSFEAGRIMLRRIMLRRINTLLENKSSFAFETTLASKCFLRLIERAQASSYLVTLVYVALPSAQLAKRRVARRVKEGGHSIPENVIERRFYRSMDNLIFRYRKVADEWFAYDNAELRTPMLVAHGSGAIEKSLRNRNGRDYRRSQR